MISEEFELVISIYRDTVTVRCANYCGKLKVPADISTLLVPYGTAYQVTCTTPCVYSTATLYIAILRKYNTNTVQYVVSDRTFGPLDTGTVEVHRIVCVGSTRTPPYWYCTATTVRRYLVAVHY